MALIVVNSRKNIDSNCEKMAYHVLLLNDGVEPGFNIEEMQASVSRNKGCSQLMNIFLGSFALRNQMYNRQMWNMSNQNNTIGTLIQNVPRFAK